MSNKFSNLAFVFSIFNLNKRSMQLNRTLYGKCTNKCLYKCLRIFQCFYITVESLQSHMILTMSHWSSGLTCLLPAIRVTGSNPLGGLM